jgi:rhodanese-related sulfurtransferase
LTWIASVENGYATDMASKGTESLDVHAAREEIAGGDAIAVDVRDADAWSEGHVPGAIHLPGGDPEAGTKRIEEGTRLIVFADDAGSGREAASKLSEAGYDAVAVDGGMDDWVSENFQIQPTPDPDEDTELGLG